MKDGFPEEEYDEFTSCLKEYIEAGSLIIACDIEVEEQLISTEEIKYLPSRYYDLRLVK